MLKKRLTILLLLAIVFFFVYSYLNFQIPLNPPLLKGEIEGDFIFNSPDETSAYFFSRLFADSPTKLRNGYENYENLEPGGLRKLESLNFLAPGLIHPRSVLVNSAGHLVPGGFLGMPLIYGSLAKIPLIPPFIKGETKGDFGAMAIPFFTPFFAVLGVIAFYFLLRKIWDENTAFLSAVLMFFLPPFWYYSTRGMFPNVLFVSLLIISAAFFFGIQQKGHPEHGEGSRGSPQGDPRDSRVTEFIPPLAGFTPPTAGFPRYSSSPLAPQNDGWGKKFLEYIRYCGGGLFFGLALITRTSEIVWLGILGLALAVYFIKKIYWPAAVLGFAVLCATFLPVLHQNKILYGSMLGSGYNISAINISHSERSEESQGRSPASGGTTTPDVSRVASAFVKTTADRSLPPARNATQSVAGGQDSSLLSVAQNDSLNQRFSALVSEMRGVVQRGKNLLFPFGVHPRAVWQNFWNYFIEFFWWFTIPMLLGALMFLCQICRGVGKIKYDFLSTTHGKSEILNPKSETISNDQNSNDQNKLFRILKIRIFDLFRISNFEFRIFNETVSRSQIIYFLSFGFISLYLFFYYGSWQIFDNINFQKITIGNSYLRYWLLIFIMGLPFVALFVKKVVATFRLRNRRLNPAATIFVLGFLCFSVFMSALSVFAGEDEGIFYVKNQLLRYNEVKQAALKLTEENSIIITERSDKIFFPDRRIIVWKRGEALDENFKNLSKFVPLYYYNIAFTDNELRTANQESGKLDLRLELVKVFGNEALYKLIPKSESRNPK